MSRSKSAADHYGKRARPRHAQGLMAFDLEVVLARHVVHGPQRAIWRRERVLAHP